MYDMNTTYQRAEQGMEAMGGEITRRSSELSSTTEAALTKVAAWDQHMRSQTVSMATAAKSAEEAGRLLEGQTRDMREVINEASALVELLKERRGQAAVSDFMQQATFVNEQLESLAVDMNRVLETTITEDELRRFSKGETGIFVRKMLGFREKAKLNIVRDKYQRDAEFREYVTRYLNDFSGLLNHLANLDQESMLRTTFLSADVGKVYMLLSRALGRDMITG